MGGAPHQKGDEVVRVFEDDVELASLSVAIHQSIHGLGLGSVELYLKFRQSMMIEDNFIRDDTHGSNISSTVLYVQLFL